MSFYYNKRHPEILHKTRPFKLSILKHLKCFTVSETLEAIGFERDTFPVEYHGVIRRAVLDPNSLSYQKLMELVRLICSKAVENVQHSGPAAHLCVSIIKVCN